MMRPRLLTTSQGTSLDAFGPLEWALLSVTALMWGSSFLWIAQALEHFHPFVISLGRIVLGAGALATVRRARRPVEREDRPSLVLLGIVWMAIPLLLFPVAQQWVASSIAGMINGGVPLFAGAVGALLLRKVPRATQLLGLVVGFAGVVTITLASTGGGGGSVLGVALLLTATACYGIALNLSVPLVQKYGSLPVILRAQLVALVVIAPFGFVGVGSSTWSWTAAGSVLVLGVLSTGLAFVAMGNLVRRVGATRGSITIYFIPVIATVLGVVVRDESVGLAALIGMAMVIVGAWLGSRREV